MSITLTPAAATQIKKSAQLSKLEGLPLRIAVMQKPDGKFHYALGFDDASHPDDLGFKSEGVNLVISGESLMLAKEMKIDFVEIETDKSRFIFLNPNDPDYVPPKE